MSVDSEWNPEAHQNAQGAFIFKAACSHVIAFFYHARLFLLHTRTHTPPHPPAPTVTSFPHASTQKNTRRHAITYACSVLKRDDAVFLARRALGAERVKEGLLGRDVDEKWHGLMECDFKLPHLQERRNRPPNFTMMMSAGLHDSVRLKCQVSFLPPSSFSGFFFSLLRLLLLFLLPWFLFQFAANDILDILSHIDHALSDSHGTTLAALFGRTGNREMVIC